MVWCLKLQFEADGFTYIIVLTCRFWGDGLHVQKIEERRKDIMDYVKAFVVGGIILSLIHI